MAQRFALVLWGLLERVVEAVSVPLFFSGVVSFLNLITDFYGLLCIGTSVSERRTGILKILLGGPS